MGSLENDLLACLWAADHPLVPAEVLDALGDDLAYTTITTILARLCDKGLVHRRRDGAMFRYGPAVTEEGAAQRVRAARTHVTGRRAQPVRRHPVGARRQALRAIIDDLDAGS
jgi:predicted transcriptional regulator